MTDKKPTYALFIGPKHVKPERGMDSGSMKLTVVQIGPDDLSSTTTEIRNPEIGNPFNDLSLRCYWKASMDNGQPYAFEAQYEGSFIDLQEAERMVRTLRKIRQIERRMPVTPTTFGQWVALVAKGLGIRHLTKYVSGRGLSFNENEYRTYRLSDAQSIIDNAIRTCQLEQEVAA